MRGAGAREALVALLAAAVVFALPLREALLDPRTVAFGVDAVTVQQPWASVLPPADEARPRNPELGDLATNFYPYYRWMMEARDRGLDPAWNPLVYLGAPMAGNPQSGYLDPATELLRLGWRAGGLRGFHWTLGALAWLRLVAAGLGAYLLARALGLARAPAALAGAAFGFSGFLLLWLNWPHGHVAPLLPWVLLGVEGARGPRPVRALLLTATAQCLAVLGGHPETAFFLGATAGVWAVAVLREDTRAGLRALGGLALGTLMASHALLSFLEYLMESTAHGQRSVMGAPPFDAVGAAACAAFAAWIALRAPGSRRAPARVVALLGLAALLALRNDWAGEAVVLLHDAYGAPGDGRAGYRGPLALCETGAGWVAGAALALALASFASGAGPLRRRGLAAGSGAVLLGLCLEAPGLADAWAHLPLVGLAALQRAGSASALMLALLAADGLAGATRTARAAAALGIAAAAGALLLAPGPAPLPERPAVEDARLGFLVPPDSGDGHGPRLPEGWIAPDVPADRAGLVAWRLDGEGRATTFGRRVPLELHGEPSTLARELGGDRLARVPPGALHFRAAHALHGYLEDGRWELEVQLFRAGEWEPFERRTAGVFGVARRPAPRGATLALVAAGLLLAALAPRGAAGGVALVLVAIAQGLWFARGLNPAVPEGEVFPETLTGEVLRRELGLRRFFSEPGVLPPDTGMVLGVRGLDGYDGMSPFLYDAYRPLAMPFGANALLDWDARGADLSSPAFRLLGVGALVLGAPFSHPEWELVAGPAGSGAREPAETWIYAPRDPLPLAFCVGEVLSVEEVVARLPDFDPRRTAGLQEDWRPERPFATAEVTDLAIEATRVSLRARLDGDGLLVTSEQAFPGWTAAVDGRPAPVLTANGIFRAVALGAGEHEVVFSYASPALRTGTRVSLAALGALVALAALGRRRSAQPARRAPG